jgi:hypothetical protein
MLARVALFAVLQTVCSVAQSSPESFQIGALNGDTWTIIDVQPISPAEVRARVIEVFPVCGTYHVRETDYVFENTSVAKLAQQAAVCMPRQRTANFVLLSTRTDLTEPVTASQIIAARCGTDLVVHRLPPVDSLRFSALQAHVPKVSHLFTLADDLKKLYSDKTAQDGTASHPAVISTPVTDRALLEATAAEIRAGKYNLVLPDIPPGKRNDGVAKLSDAMPPPEIAGGGADHDSGELLGREHLALDQLPEIVYPQMGRVAHISGDVAADLSIDPQSGNVLSAAPTSGHPILRAAVLDATKAWVFTHPYLGHNPLPVIVRFRLCFPPVLETSQSTVSVSRKRRRHRTKKQSKYQKWLDE